MPENENITLHEISKKKVVFNNSNINFARTMHKLIFITFCNMHVELISDKVLHIFMAEIAHHIVKPCCTNFSPFNLFVFRWNYVGAYVKPTFFSELIMVLVRQPSNLDCSQYFDFSRCNYFFAKSKMHPAHSAQIICILMQIKKTECGSFPRNIYL